MKKFSAFISIPKCGTKTILEMYRLGMNRDNDEEEKRNCFVIYENHQRLKILENKFNLENKFVFTLVRNPYDRIKSWYEYHKFISPIYYNTSLNNWIKMGCPTHWKIQNKTNWAKEGLSPLLQYNFIEGNKKIDFIGKMENFEEDNRKIIAKLNRIFRENNVKKRIIYKDIKLNSKKWKTNEKITNENKELIYKMFKKDFDYFGYSK